MTLAAHNLTVPGRLSGIDLTLQPGTLTAIVGPNGAGKSTLLAALTGIEPAAAPGRVELDDAVLGTLPPRARARAIGYLPQTGEVAWDLNVETLVRLGRLPHRAGPAADHAAVERALDELGLQTLRTRPLNRLSGGERARALLGRVLAGTPRWVLADEPLASLDLAHQQAMLGCFKALARQGCGVVLVLHDLAHAMNHADRVVVIDHGAIVADGPPAEALDRARIAAVWGLKAQWLGETGQQALAF
ncbi:MAG: hypothetical protein RLZZ427_1870 [Pseudomonadota bacterium]|jgi:iron complex transport system ATP-binding protein